MRILAISPKIPEPGKKGFQALSYFRLLHLSRNHDVSIICFGSLSADAVAKRNLEFFGIKVQLIHRNFFETILQLCRSIYRSDIPLQCLLFNSRSFKRAINESFANHNPDLIYSFTFRVLDNLSFYIKPLFIDLVDSMALNFSRRLLGARGISKFLLLIEYRRILKYEKKVTKIATQSCVVSSLDKAMIASNSVMVLPLGVDTKVFYKNHRPPEVPTIIFTGNMSYKPNIEAVLWFYKNCWSKLKDSIPSLHFIIAGNNPSHEIKKLAKHDSIIVTGGVPSIAKLLNNSHVSIAPMQSGSGMQFKILESMACGVPVVTTSLGLGDIRAIVNEEIFVADLPDSFSEIILGLLQSSELREMVGDSGLRYALANHSWDVLNRKIEESLMNTTKHTKVSQSFY